METSGVKAAFVTFMVGEVLVAALAFVHFVAAVMPLVEKLAVLVLVATCGVVFALIGADVARDVSR